MADAVRQGYRSGGGGDGGGGAAAGGGGGRGGYPPGSAKKRRVFRLAKISCLHCRRSKQACDDFRPCTRCMRLGLNESPSGAWGGAGTRSAPSPPLWAGGTRAGRYLSPTTQPPGPGAAAEAVAPAGGATASAATSPPPSLVDAAVAALGATPAGDTPSVAAAVATWADWWLRYGATTRGVEGLGELRRLSEMVKDILRRTAPPPSPSAAVGEGKGGGGRGGGRGRRGCHP
ncbi:hypothetical protein I4F81_009744 [Pyropia yezoensis]|uniref:Uncharacterized protein n=1 Tax=Pyropia yezoensis TaxID=2788 RepID=A0ACC3CBS5_PYRYE|nr:hypothetical protein I4F81_009744 [Neopyropia yezoensis]